MSADEDNKWGLSVGAVAVKDGRVLLVKRDGTLTLPLGHMRSEERREETCVRVVCEQTGINIKTGRIVGIGDGDRYFIFEGKCAEGSGNGKAVWLEPEAALEHEEVSRVAKIHIDAYMNGFTRLNRPF